MDENTKWLSGVYQKYLVVQVREDGSTNKSFYNITKIIQLSLKAGNASEAMLKAIAWLDESGIKDAHVGYVQRDGIDEIDVEPVDPAESEFIADIGG